MRERYVWVAYGDDPARLPIAVADSARELGAILGTTKSSIMSTWSKYNAGRLKSCRYHRVNIGADDIAPPWWGDLAVRAEKVFP